MALKTSILRLKNFLPLSTDVATAMAVDGAVVLDEQATVEQVAAEMDVETPEDQPELEEGEA
jgi:recombinational DNA repair protein RecT